MSVTKRALTGSRPSGHPHLGNYFGAFKPIIDLQTSTAYGPLEVFFFLADYHAFNTQDALENIRDYSIDLAATMIACGFDVEKHTFYSQSRVSEVCELAWLLGCLTPYGFMARAHSFKDAQAKNTEVNCGVFNYPILMAADILCYQADYVPVGKDQKQNLEMARDLAIRMNNQFADTMKIPEPLISVEQGVVPGLDGEKMSSSKGNVIPIFATDKQWKKAVMSIQSDSKELDEPKDPDSCIIVQIFKLFASSDELAEMQENYRKGGYGYGHAKLALLEKIKQSFSEPREKYLELKANPNQLVEIIEEGSKKARAIARHTLAELKEKIGFL